MMIKAIIIDDEQHCINRLSGLLDEHCKETVHVMGNFLSLEEGINAIYKLQPALVFLDVQLGEHTGFDLLKQLNEINFEVIFTTAFDKYAVQAFKFCAIDYLLKPIDADDLKLAVDKLSKKISKEEVSKQFEVLFHNLKHVGSLKRICVPVMTGFVFLQVNDIIRCESDINYTTIFLSNKQKLLVAKTLKEFEELLSDHDFFRVHNSHLINLAHIKSYNKGKGGFVTLDDNSQIEVSTRRKEEFLKKLAAV